MDWESVIGLEVHTELSTETKIFCSCPTSFGQKPNTCVCEVCTGMPGTLPVLNEKAVEYAVRTGLALGCEISETSRFDRKNYFYPDLPKAYQITQLYAPICTNGTFEISGGRTIGIHEIHMEEDAGKLLHTDNNETLIDYNRAGVPLLEIVTEPDLRSAEEAVEFLQKLRAVLQFIGVSDCKMQEGSLRADVNVSLKIKGATELGTRTEMKNLNSFGAVERAINYEINRQKEILENGGEIVRQTRRWDDRKGESTLMRSKENAMDYKYFPEPDLPALKISTEKIEQIKAALPELPEQKIERYKNDYSLSDYDAQLICTDINYARFFEKTVALGAGPKQAANWLSGEVLRLLKESATESCDNPLKPEALVKIIDMVARNKINRNTGKAVLERVFYDKVEPEEYVDKNCLSQISDIGEIQETLRKVIAENTKSVGEYQSGKEKAFKFIVGQSMRALGGKADAKLVQEILHELLDS